MIFIATCSQDTTTDLLLPFLGENSVFRFNIDRPDDFCWDFHADGFSIKDRNGNEITDKNLTSFYLRKPMFFDFIDIPKCGSLENWRREETVELFQDFYRDCESRNLTALVQCRNTKYGKLRQMRLARKYFKVAPWHLFHGELPAEMTQGRWVVKSLTGTMIGINKMLFVKEVDPAAIDLSYPWFMQKRIDGEEEVTVTYIVGKIYAASVRRDSLGGEDSRKAVLEQGKIWPRCQLTPNEETAIRGFMAETGHRFGRFDFIRKDGELWFLELNPNGQWAWLDPENKNGLISMVADAIKEDDRRHRAKLQTLSDLRRHFSS